VVDLSVRHSNHHGPDGKQSLNTMRSGGVAPSRLGFNVQEDLGSGTTAFAVLETRFQAHNGTPDSPVNYWQHSYLGLNSQQWGRVTVGRDYNVLFDVMATTFAPFAPAGPFLNSYKPEASMLLGARSDSLVKYRYTLGAFSVAAQYSFKEGEAFSTSTGRSWGGNMRYASGPWAAGLGHMQRKDADDRKARAYMLGGSYRTDALYLNAFWARSQFDNGFNTALMLVGLGIDNTVVPSHPGQTSMGVQKRTLWSFGGMVRLNQWQLGAQYWRMNQRFYVSPGHEAQADFLALLASYSLSKRTALYGAVEYTKLKNLQLTNMQTSPATPNGQRNRSTFMVGMVHRF
jgi:predicted porin